MLYDKFLKENSSCTMYENLLNDSDSYAEIFRIEGVDFYMLFDFVKNQDSEIVNQKISEANLKFSDYILPTNNSLLIKCDCDEYELKVRIEYQEISELMIKKIGAFLESLSENHLDIEKYSMPLYMISEQEMIENLFLEENSISDKFVKLFKKACADPLNFNKFGFVEKGHEISVIVETKE